MNSCRNCKHFRPVKDIITLWGICKNDHYYRYAKCGLPLADGTEAFCKHIRSSQYDDLYPKYIPCNSSGAAFEPK